MANFKLFVEFEGTRYSGWQVQKNARTVQGILLECAFKIFNTNDLELQGSGRTDAGVHALEQIAHLKVKTMLAPEIIRMKFNDILPADINLLEVEKTSDKFHSRHSAKSRSYIYIISKRRTAFNKNFVWWIKDSLDIAMMKNASQKFIGMHDFKSFCDKDNEEKSTKVLLTDIQFKETDNLIMIRIIGSHFLWKMVRRLIGTIVEVGRHKKSAKDIEYFLHNLSNEPAKFTAPPSGLFLEKINYTDSDEVLAFPMKLLNLE